MTRLPILSESFVACRRSRWKWLYFVPTPNWIVIDLFNIFLQKLLAFLWIVTITFIVSSLFIIRLFIFSVSLLDVSSVHANLNGFSLCQWLCVLILFNRKEAKGYPYISVHAQQKKKWRTQEELFDCCSHIKFIVGISTGSKRSHLITNLRRPLKG